MRKYNVVKDKPDDRDYHYGSEKIVKPKLMPKFIDLRDKCSPIVDQGDLGSCTACSIVSGLREYLLIRSKKALVRLSRLFLYWEERSLEGTVNEDAGAEIRDGMKVLQKLGVCPEKNLPYKDKNLKVRPNKVDHALAKPYAISQYSRITSLTLLKSALSSGQVCVIGFNVYDSFESDQVSKTGIVPMPKIGEELLGGHAVCVVGYDDLKGWIIVRNSWGTDWGDKGYFYFPYDVFNKLVMDMWTGK